VERGRPVRNLKGFLIKNNIEILEKNKVYFIDYIKFIRIINKNGGLYKIQKRQKFTVSVSGSVKLIEGTDQQTA